MIRISNLNLNLNYTQNDIKLIVSKKLSVHIKHIKNIKIFRLSIDSRRKNNIHFVACVDVELSIPEKKILKNCSKDKNISSSIPYFYKLNKAKSLSLRPVIIGFGPAGMFCALILARLNLNPIVIEYGKKVDERIKDVEKFWHTGILDTSSNVQFGEGGAGTFSDGKLNTGTKDIRSRFILSEFVKHGAPEEILYLAKPHIGTDKLRSVVKSIRKEIESLGGDILFQTKFCGFKTKNNKIYSIETEDVNGKINIIHTNNLVLAIGHSARNTFKLLFENNLKLIQKPFSVGLRIEHRREFIDKLQYGKKYLHKAALSSANYKLSTHLSSGRGVYTFCMCPGGQVVAASSEKNMIATNGMSKFLRNMENSNSALLVNVCEKDFASSHPLAGIDFQRKLENAAFKVGGENYNAPVCRLEDFLKNHKSNFIGDVIPSYKPGFTLANLSEILPEFITCSLQNGLLQLDKKMPGFNYPDAILTAVETRSSSPVRIPRNPDTLESTQISGLYPCGEGAGFAGGIISAAVDGIKCAEKIAYIE